MAKIIGTFADPLIFDFERLQSFSDYTKHMQLIQTNAAVAGATQENTRMEPCERIIAPHLTFTTLPPLCSLIQFAAGINSLCLASALRVTVFSFHTSSSSGSCQAGALQLPSGLFRRSRQTQELQTVSLCHFEALRLRVGSQPASLLSVSAPYHTTHCVHPPPARTAFKKLWKQALCEVIKSRSFSRVGDKDPGQFCLDRFCHISNSKPFQKESKTVLFARRL